jgi:hypothetical protein
VKKFTAALFLALACSLTAKAAITEIRKDFPKQSSALSPAAILSAPGSNASYLVCVYLSQSGSANTLSAIIRWTDENSQSQSFTFSSPARLISNCDPIRNLAHTVPTVETSGTYHATYDLYVVGFGFWTTGSQGQGGITEPFANWHLSGGPITLLSPVGAATYMLALDCSDQGAAGTLNWTDEVGVQTVTVSPSLNGALIPVHVAGASNLVFTGGSCFVSAVSMGTPKAGSGPITDYELNMLKYTDVTWPNSLAVVPATAEAPTTTYAFAANIAQQPNFSGYTLEIFGGDLFVQILYAGENGAPGNSDGTALTFPAGIVGANYRAGDPYVIFDIATAINRFTTFGWGASPTYSAEVDVIRF